MFKKAPSLLVSLFILLSTNYALAFQEPGLVSDTELLKTPKRAVHTFLNWQMPGHENPELVIKTMKLSDADNSQKYELAQRLKQVLDARGLIVVYDEIPSNPDYTDSLSGMQHYILFRELPEVYLVRVNNEWVFSEKTISAIPQLYSTTFSSAIGALINLLPEWAMEEWLGIKIWQYIAVFIWLLLGFMLKKIIEFILDTYVKRLTNRTSFQWDDHLVLSVERPVGFIAMMIYFLLTYTNLHFSVDVNYFLSHFFRIGISAGVIWMFYNLSEVLSRYLGYFASKTGTELDDQLIPIIRKTLRFFVVVIGVIAILQNNGYNVASLIAGLGIGGLAVALAAQETLANFFGSVTIITDRPYKIGDWIVVNDIEGTVEDIGFRSTRIRTFHDSLVSVPNSLVAKTDVENYGLRRYRRLKTILNLTYSTTPEQMEAFTEGIKAIIKSNKHFRQDNYHVYFNSYGAHSLDVLVYVFFDVPDWSSELQQKHNFFLEVLKLAEDIGVEFAFPTQTLHMDSFYKDEPRKIGKDVTMEELAETVTDYGPDGKKSNPDGVKLYKDGEEIKF